ncbi:MAG: FtsH protease activity modulator HflK [Acidobacteria bacterium]|nr:FtsH protease activity modulator HflK [Acidobacteriota bacterium]
MPEDLDELIEKLQRKRQRGFLGLPGRWGGYTVMVAVVLVAILVTGYYQVGPNETGVVLRFGKFLTETGPGPHFKMPFGIDRVFKVRTSYQFKEEFGFRTKKAGIHTQFAKGDYSRESNILTGDLNIAVVTWVVQYRIRDPRAYLFNVRNVRGTLRDVSEAAMRTVVGDMSFNEAIKLKRRQIESSVKEKMQHVLDRYGCGVSLFLVQIQDVHPPVPVEDSFDEVNRARQEMDQAINEAYQQYNKVIYRVKGEALQTVKAAAGAKIERVNRAKGDAAYFSKLLVEYRKAPRVTKRRLFLETMRRVLPRLRQVYVVDANMKGLVPLLDLRGTKTGGGK